jgi:hypothetical protein
LSGILLQERFPTSGNDNYAAIIMTLCLAVVDNIVRGEWDVPALIFGIAGALVIFIGGYTLEGGIER